jgi:ribosomal protein S18 acetylase RimI-like enzyme
MPRALEAVRIRSARAGDGAAVARGWDALGAMLVGLDPATFRRPDASGLDEWMEAELAKDLADDSVITLVAELDGAVVGFVSAELEAPLPDAGRQVAHELARPRGTVHVMAVDEAHRRRGIGTRLLAAAEDALRERGAEVVFLDTHVRNEPGIAMYERRMGYSRRSIRYMKRL